MIIFFAKKVMVVLDMFNTRGKFLMPNKKVDMTA